MNPFFPVSFSPDPVIRTEFTAAAMTPENGPFAFLSLPERVTQLPFPCLSLSLSLSVSLITILPSVSLCQGWLTIEFFSLRLSPLPVVLLSVLVDL